MNRQFSIVVLGVVLDSGAGYAQQQAAPQQPQQQGQQQRPANPS
jgi:hypothetical protein